MSQEDVAAKVKLSRAALMKLLLFAILAWGVFGLVSFFGPPLLRCVAPTLAASIEPGTFGDMFGAGNAFFSALAFAAVAYTLWLQTQELEEARAERREARADSKENIKLQEAIAKSQEEAAKAQLKVAQSGDVYRAYARVYGSDFIGRYFRLCWLFSHIEKDKSSLEDIEKFLKLGSLGRHLHQRASGKPARYDPTFVGLYAEGERVNRGEVVAKRVHEDIEQCADAIVDLWPAYHMGLLDVQLLALNEEFVSESPMRSFQQVREWLAVICPADRGRLGVIDLFVNELTQDWHRWMKEEFGDDWQPPL